VTLATPPFRKILRDHVWTLPGNMRDKLEVRSFNRFKLVWLTRARTHARTDTQTHIERKQYVRRSLRSLGGDNKNVWLVVCGACQSSLYNSTAVLLTVWSDYEMTVRSVADVQSQEPYLDMIQSQVNALPQSFTASNDSTSLYSVWNYMSGQLPVMTDSLQALSTQVSSRLILILETARRWWFRLCCGKRKMLYKFGTNV